MKKILIFSGNHPRHIFINKTFLEYDFDVSLVLMKRENLIPNYENNINNVDDLNIKRHFNERYIKEKSFFGIFESNDEIKNIYNNCNVLECEPESLNTNKVKKFVQDFSPDFVFIFGTNIIKDPIIRILPENTINLHLGLSPWYRGSATLFWPFYFLQPQYAGSTFHKIVVEPDAGDILHQCVPILNKGDEIHDVGVNTVLKSKEDLKKIISHIQNEKELIFHKQINSGKNFLTSEFRPEHLRVIYNQFNNDIVDFYLKNSERLSKPNLKKIIF